MKSEQLNELAAALCKAQAALRPAAMNATNPFLKNKYADLGAVIEAARKPMADNGLSISQLVGGDDAVISITTILLHNSGQWLESTVSMTMGEERGKSAAQVAGSIITYLRRYSFASVLGIYADEDTDGSESKQDKPSKAQPATKPAQSAPQAEPEQQTELIATTSQDEPYTTIDTKSLTARFNAMQKKIRAGEYTSEELAEKQHKCEEITRILAERRAAAQQE